MFVARWSHAVLGGGASTRFQSLLSAASEDGARGGARRDVFAGRDAGVGNRTTLTAKNKDGSKNRLNPFSTLIEIISQTVPFGVVMNFNDMIGVALMNVAGQELRLRWLRSAAINRQLLLI